MSDPRETGRTTEGQELFEHTLIHDLESAYYASRDWRKPQASTDYRTRFIDAMIRIQAGDIKTVGLTFEKEQSGREFARLKLPVISYAARSSEISLTYHLEYLEKDEPNVRDLMPLE